MRFELFVEARSVGWISWERAGRLRMHVRDPDLGHRLVSRLGSLVGDSAPGGPVAIAMGDDGSSRAFERVLHDMARELGFSLAARPAAAPGDPPSRR